MIEFRCPNCNQKITARADRAGMAGRCPRCKSKIPVPDPPHPDTRSHHLRENDANDITVRATHRGRPGRGDTTHDNSQPGQARWPAPTAVFDSQASPQYAGERHHPWFLDILLYPTSVSGVMVLALLAGAPLLAALFARIVPLLGALMGLPLFIAGLLLGLYAACYFAECVYDSAMGGTRAPDAIGAKGTIGEMWSRFSYMLAVYIVYVLPVVIYRMVLNGTDWLFWVLVAWAVLFFPIGLLAMVLWDSISALNPFFLLSSIVRVFFPYAGLLTLFALVAISFRLASGGEPDQVPPLWTEVVGLIMGPYVALVLAHVLGRFYWRYSDRLDWGV